MINMLIFATFDWRLIETSRCEQNVKERIRARANSDWNIDQTLTITA